MLLTLFSLRAVCHILRWLAGIVILQGSLPFSKQGAVAISTLDRMKQISRFHFARKLSLRCKISYEIVYGTIISVV